MQALPISDIRRDPSTILHSPGTVTGGVPGAAETGRLPAAGRCRKARVRVDSAYTAIYNTDRRKRERFPHCPQWQGSNQIVRDYPIPAHTLPPADGPLADVGHRSHRTAHRHIIDTDIDALRQMPASPCCFRPAAAAGPFTSSAVPLFHFRRSRYRPLRLPRQSSAQLQPVDCLLAGAGHAGARRGRWTARCGTVRPRWYDADLAIPFTACSLPVIVSFIIYDQKPSWHEALHADRRFSARIAAGCRYCQLYVTDLATASGKCRRRCTVFGIDQLSAHAGGAGTFLHPIPATSCSAYHLKSNANASALITEYKVVRINDKAVRWVHGLASWSTMPTAIRCSASATIQDITERKLAEEELAVAAVRSNQEQHDHHHTGA